MARPGMRGRPVTAGQMAWLLHRSTHLGFPAPQLRSELDVTEWDAGDLAGLLDQVSWTAEPFATTLRVTGMVDGRTLVPACRDPDRGSDAADDDPPAGSAVDGDPGPARHPAGMVRPRLRPPRPRGAGAAAAGDVPDHLADQALPGRTRPGPAHRPARAARPGPAGRGRTVRHPGPVGVPGPRLVAPRRLRHHRSRVLGERGTGRHGVCAAGADRAHLRAARPGPGVPARGTGPDPRAPPRPPGPDRRRRRRRDHLARRGIGPGGTSPGPCWMGGRR